MPNKVIALIYSHGGDGVYHTEATLEAKRLLRKANKALGEHYGHRVGTVFGDGRGKDSQGNSVLGYALCMETPAEQVPWLLETFWGGGAPSFVETIPGVGYLTTSKGKCKFFDLDISKGDAAVEQFLLDLTGQALKLPVAVVAPVEASPAVVTIIEPDVEVPAEPDVSDIMQLTVTDAVPMPVDFGAMTKAQLHEACTAKGVVFRKKDTTAQLIALLG